VAVGVNALQYALGSYNTALADNAGPSLSYGNITNSTAVGNLAQVTQSNSMVLGSSHQSRRAQHYENSIRSINREADFHTSLNAAAKLWVPAVLFERISH
jgi:hypothetical protein